MVAKINNISDGAGAYFLISKTETAILIFSSTNYVLKKFPAAPYDPNMVIYSIITTSVSRNSDKIYVKGVTEFKGYLPMMLTLGVVVVPYNAPNDIKKACKLAKCKYSDAWFKNETAFINKKLEEFMKSKNPFQLRQAIGNIRRSMA
jgi:hypothetical protein